MLGQKKWNCRKKRDQLAKLNGNPFAIDGAILLANDQVVVVGMGVFFKMDSEKIADVGHEGDEWQIVSLPDDPECIEVVKNYRLSESTVLNKFAEKSGYLVCPIFFCRSWFGA